jgi:hypothetical protein
MATLHTVFVVLGLPSATSALITRMDTIVDAMSTNVAIFKSPPIVLATVTGHLGDLQTAETTAQTRAKGTAAARNAKKAIVVQDAHQLHAYVQQLANATPADALAIANAAAMTLRKQPVVHKSDLSVSHVVSGTVKVVAKSASGAHAHDWQYSTDGGKTWVSVPPSLQAHTTISGFTPGTTVLFRHRDITKAGALDWGQPITAIVS